MTPDDLLDHLTGLVHRHNSRDAQWWHRAALRCWEQQHCQMIASRDGSELYLARFWLTTPKPSERSDGDGSAFESGDSVLLHHFVRGDDDGALHDHPWCEFDTSVIAGGYTERRPSAEGREDYEALADNTDIPGVSFADCETLTRRPGGPRIQRLGHHQHAVEDVLPDTWTIVTTGPRVRQWGFHPPGRPWMPWRDFLAKQRQPEPQQWSEAGS